MQTEHRKHLSARTIVLLGLLTGVVVGLLGCAHAAAPIRVPVMVPVLVVPKCELPNSFEKCKVKCMVDGKRPTDSWEDGERFECNCVPFGA